MCFEYFPPPDLTHPQARRTLLRSTARSRTAPTRATAYSPDFLKSVADALSMPAGAYPELVKPMQERLGYLVSVTGVDCPTSPSRAMPLPVLAATDFPALIRETDHVFLFLARHPRAASPATADESLRSYRCLVGDTASTSGWVVQWQGAASTGARGSSRASPSRRAKPRSSRSPGARVWSTSSSSLVSASPSRRRAGPTPIGRATSPGHQHRPHEHVQRRHFFIRDMVSPSNSGSFVRMNGIADMFASTERRDEFHRCRCSS